MSKQKILVIEDDLHIQELLRYNLERNGYEVAIIENGAEGFKEAREGNHNVIILDIMLPDMDGLEICKRLRMDKITEKTPIIMITAKGEELDKILGLELGADDYLTKPFSVKELIARIRAVLRRTNDVSIIDESESSKNIIKISDIEINIEKYEVKKNNEKIILTLKEFELLRILAENKGRVLTRDFLLDKIWGYDYVGETRTVDVHIRHLRQKIEDDDSLSQVIETIRGVGYRMNNVGD